MNRQLKFRVYTMGHMIIIDSSSDYTLEFGNEKPYLSMFSNGGEFVCRGEVENVMQFTGLTDKNGKDIYESDWLKITDKAQFTGEKIDQEYQVKFRSGCFMADNVKNGKDDDKGFEIWDTIVWHELMEGRILIEIIGNIYES